MPNEAINAAQHVYANLNSKFSIDDYPFKEFIENKIPSPLTAEIELIPDQVLDEIINTILCSIGNISKELSGINGISLLLNTYKEAGANYIEVPGLGSILKGFIRSVEANMTVMLKPYIFIIQVVKESVKKGVKAIPYFIKTVKDTISNIIDMLSDPYGVLFPVISMFMDYIVQKGNFPMPSAEVVIAMVMKPFEFDWEALLCDIINNPLSVLTLPDFFYDMCGSEKKLKIDPVTGMTYLSQYAAYFDIKIPSVDGEKCGTMFDFIKEFLLMPIKMIVGVLKSLFCTIKEMLTNLFKTIKNITELLSNPIQYVYSFVSKPLINTLSGLLSKFFPQVDIESISDILDLIFGKISDLLSFDINDLKVKICEFVSDVKKKFDAQSAYVIDQLRNFIMFIVATFLSVFKIIFNVPKIIAALFGKNGDDLTCEESNKLVEDAKKEFKVYRPTKSYTIKIDDAGKRHGVLNFYYDEDTKLEDQFKNDDAYSKVEFYHKKLSDMYGKDVVLTGEIEEINEGKQIGLYNVDPYIVLKNDPAYEYVKNTKNSMVTIAGVTYEKFILIENGTEISAMVTKQEE